MKRKSDLYMCALLLSLSTGLAAQGSAGSAEEKQPTAKLSPEARSALAAAMAGTDALKGLRGEERKVELAKNAERYEQVADRFATEFGAACKAWYESAELWRRHGSLAKAESGYRNALSKDGGRYRARAIFGIAEMERRQKKFEEAISSYEQVATIQPESNRASDSRLWIARCLRSLEKPDEAVQSFRAAVDKAATARQMIAASNFLANELVDRGELSAAEAAIDKAAARASAEIEDGAKGSEGLRAALDAMSARRALQKAKDKANGSAKDALSLELDRRRVKELR